MEISGDCVGCAGDGAVVEVPYVQWRRHRPGAGIHSQGERSRPQRIALLDPTRRFDGLAADNEWTWRAVGLVCHVVNFGATLSDAGQEDVAPHGVESVGDVNFIQHSGTTRLAADFDEASCGMYSCLAAQGRAYTELDRA